MWRQLSKYIAHGIQMTQIYHREKAATFKQKINQAKEGPFVWLIC